MSHGQEFRNPITPLATSADLVDRLPLSAVTIVLFTALWSYDTPAALHALESAPVAPRCAGDVAFYTVPLTISEVHLNPPTAPSAGALSSLWKTRSARVAFRRGNMVYNATADIPWFPSLRAFSNTSDFVDPRPYTDSFTPAAIGRFIASCCARAKAAAAIRNDDGSSCGSVRSLGVAALRSPPSSCSLEEVLEEKNITTRFLEMSPDRFNSLVHVQRENASLGAMVFMSGGAPVLLEAHRNVWDSVSRATEYENSGFDESQLGSTSSKLRTWVLTVVDSLRYTQLAERMHVDIASSLPSVILLDAKEDKVRRLSANVAAADASRTVATEMRAFAEAPGGTSELVYSAASSVPTDGKHPLLLNDNLKDMAGNRPHFEARSDGQRTSIWIVIHQPWCGFSQRALPVFTAFAEKAREMALDVCVLQLTNLDNLPGQVDALVDGFPTVVRLNGTGAKEAEEYKGPHRVGELLRIVSDSQSR